MNVIQSDFKLVLPESSGFIPGSHPPNQTEVSHVFLSPPSTIESLALSERSIPAAVQCGRRLSEAFRCERCRNLTRQRVSVIDFLTKLQFLQTWHLYRHALRVALKDSTTILTSYYFEYFDGIDVRLQLSLRSVSFFSFSSPLSPIPLSAPLRYQSNLFLSVTSLCPIRKGRAMLLSRNGCSSSTSLTQNTSASAPFV